MRFGEYRRENVVNYARKWAYLRNPEYYNYDSIGGDCTNFASQCIYSGSKIMNYNNNGWYYRNSNDKSPSWTGVEFLYNFLINNKGVGPYGRTSKMSELEIGDIVQLSFDGTRFTHTLVIVKIGKPENLDKILVATHTFDSYGRSVSSYSYSEIRFIKIEGIRKW